ncbi:uncharacterized protein N7459_001615 [Penicillium hispanicum]|uniref:uncharacterized protein n=1 Tax=Penicillium hispanicum TaxID=1080232 RepID=UPI0025422EB2|nr:uncharacterized protein N7459_001615 [Penicillium hispanicum]KAJ5595407.1 hypothetical protein N7459_001615 [Penicillium hispanicum]
MSNAEERQAEDLYERDNDQSPVTGSFRDSSYANETRSDLRNTVPVQSDNQSVDDPVQPPFSNSDQQLEQDENEALDRSNILRGDRLRHTKPRTSTGYSEGPDEDDLPAEAQ